MRTTPDIAGDVLFAAKDFARRHKKYGGAVEAVPAGWRKRIKRLF